MSEVHNDYKVEVKTVEIVPTAVVRGHAPLRQHARSYSRAVRRILWRSAAGSSARTQRCLLSPPGRKIPPEGVPIEVGVQFAAPCEPHGKVVCSSTPAGMVATVTHWGDYADFAMLTTR